MASNSGYLDDGKYTTTSSLSLVASRATLATVDLVTSTLSVGGAATFSSTTISALADGVGSGAAIGPTNFFTSEASLGFFRSGTSQIATSYGTLNLGGGLAFTSEISLGFNRSAASQIQQSYGTFNAVGLAASSILATTGLLISSSTTAQSASSVKIPNQGQIVFSILSLTTNGAAMYYRSGNSVYGWASGLAVG
jgi:hypothetical protein